MTEAIYDKETGMLSITDDVMEAEFKVATQQALDNNDLEFDFYGYVIETELAMDVMQTMNERRTFH